MINYRESDAFRAIRKGVLSLIDFFYPLFRWLMPKQTYRYLVSGGTVTVLGLVAYYLSYNFILSREIVYFGDLAITRYIAAYLLSFCVSFPVGFFLSKFVVFQDSSLKGKIQLFRYGLLQGLNIVINWALLHFFAGFLGFWATPSQALATVFIAVFSYFFQRYFTFRVKTPANYPDALVSEKPCNGELM